MGSALSVKCCSTSNDQFFPSEGEQPPMEKSNNGAVSVQWSVPSTDEEVEHTARQHWQQAVNDNNMFAIQNLYEEYGDRNIEETIFDDGSRAVHRAIKNNNFDLLVYLASTCQVKMGAPDAINANTPLSLAIQLDRFDMVRFLTGQHPEHDFDNNAPMDSKDFVNVDGKSAVDYAALHRNVQIWYLVCPEKDLATYQPRGSDAPVSPKKPEVKTTASTEDLDGKQEVDEIEKIPEKMQDVDFLTVDLNKPFSGWLQKRRAASKATKPRWVITVGDHIGWSVDELEVESIPENKGKFKKFYPLADIHGVEVMEMDDDDERWFRFRGAQNALKFVVYEFQAEDRRERDEWVNQLCERIEEVTGKKIMR